MVLYDICKEFYRMHEHVHTIKEVYFYFMIILQHTLQHIVTTHLLIHYRLCIPKNSSSFLFGLQNVQTLTLLTKKIPLSPQQEV